MIKPLSGTKITGIPVNLSAYYYNILVTKIEAFYSPTYVEKKIGRKPFRFIFSNSSNKIIYSLGT
jgi:hypothetical protein